MVVRSTSDSNVSPFSISTSFTLGSSKKKIILSIVWNCCVYVYLPTQLILIEKPICKCLLVIIIQKTQVALSSQFLQRYNSIGLMVTYFNEVQFPSFLYLTLIYHSESKSWASNTATNPAGSVQSPFYFQNQGSLKIQFTSNFYPIATCREHRISWVPN